MKDKHAKHVARALIKYVALFGVPLTLFSDQGKEFDNELVSHLCRFVGTTKMRTTPYYPQADGLTENHVKTCKDMLATFIDPMQTDWAEYLDIVQLLYNTTVSSATGYSPLYLMFGRECSLARLENIGQDLPQLSTEDRRDYADIVTFTMGSV